MWPASPGHWVSEAPAGLTRLGFPGGRQYRHVCWLAARQLLSLN